MDFYRVPDHYLIGHGAIAGKEATFFVDTGLVTVDPNGRQPGLSISSESFKAFGGEGDFTEVGFADAPGPIRLGPVELEKQGLYVQSRFPWFFVFGRQDGCPAVPWILEALCLDHRLRYPYVVSAQRKTAGSRPG